jgi:pyridoxamine---pyruvate transaminase
MSLIALSARAWDAMESNPQAPRGSFLSLLDWKHRWIDGGRVAFPYTPSVADVAGVQAALQDVIDVGIEETIATHARAARACRAGVVAMGLQLWPRSESYAANCVTAVRVPSGVTPATLLAHVRARYGVMLSGGYGELKDKLIRLGHMGPASRSLYPLVAVSALGRGLVDLGVSVDIGAGAQAVMEALAQPAPRELSEVGS